MAIGIVSLNLFWTYIEIGVGFLVACLPPSAQLTDRFSFDPITKILRSIRSLLSWKRDIKSVHYEAKSVVELPTGIPPEPLTGQQSDQSFGRLTRNDSLEMEC